MSSLQESPRKRRPWQPPPVDAALLPTHPNQVLSFAEWAFVNGFSPRTGRRIVARGEGPEIVQLSKQKIGVTVAANAKWQRSRVRKGA